MARLLDEALPAWDVREVHSAWVPAPPERAYAAVRAVIVGEVRLLAPLMAIRLLPALAAGRRPHGAGLAAPVLDAMVANGFSILGERPPDELAIGAIGRFWSLSAETTLRRVPDAPAFAAFDEPGYAKAATDFRLAAEGGGSRVTTETRVAGTDAAATRTFRRYWRVIGLGSGLVRVSWLNAVRRRVEG